MYTHIHAYTYIHFDTYTYICISYLHTSGMIGVETRNAVADAMGTAELRHLGSVILGKLTGGSLDEACLHYNIV